MRKLKRLFLSSVTLIAGGLAASAADAQVIGIAAPLSGPYALLGNQVRVGAAAAADAITDRATTLNLQDDACSADGGAAAARAFAAAEVEIVVGFLCTESIMAALPILAEAEIPVVTPGVRTNSLTDLRDRQDWPVYRLAPRDDGEEKAIEDLLVPLWRDVLFAIVDDGTIYGRNLAESFRAAAEATGLKPVFVDTYRPQMENQVGLVGRLRRAGATHVFVGGDREDVAIMGRDAAQLDAPLIFAGGEALRAPTVNTPLAEGTLMIAPPNWSEVAATDVLLRLRAADAEPDGYVVPAYAAVEVAAAALDHAQSGKQSLRQTLDSQTFTTALGEIRFDEKGDLTTNPFRLHRFNGTTFDEVEP